MARSAASRKQERLDQEPTPTKPLLSVIDGPHYADNVDVKNFASGLKESFLHCRELGHNWKPLTASSDKDGGGFHRLLRCTRCRTKREEALDRGGMKISTRYEHPEGYLTDGIGRIVGEGRGLLRLEALKRLQGKEV